MDQFLFWEAVVRIVRYFSNIPDLYSLDASSTLAPSFVSTKNVSGHYQMEGKITSVGASSLPQLGTIALKCIRSFLDKEYFLDFSFVLKLVLSILV